MRFTSKIRQANVTIEHDSGALRCKACDQVCYLWRESGKRLPARYWQCPNSCNSSGDEARR